MSHFDHEPDVPPTHILVIEVPMDVPGDGPKWLNDIALGDTLKTILALIRVSGRIAGTPQVTLNEVPDPSRPRPERVNELRAEGQ